MVVQRVICPPVSMPTVNNTGAPFRGEIGSGESRKRPRSRDKDLDMRQKAIVPNVQNYGDLELLREQVTAFGRGASQKRAKKNEDTLIRLGVAPAKQQKMPFKMRMGLLSSRAKHEKKNLARSKESGVVLPTKLKDEPKKKRDSERQPGLGLPSGSVLNLNKGKRNRDFIAKVKQSSSPKSFGSKEGSMKNNRR